MRHGWIVASLFFLTGCTGASGPTLAGGKPVQHWLDAVHSSIAKVRKEAVSKLGNVGQADPAAFPAVLQALRDTDPAVRREAIVALLKFGRQADNAVPELTELSIHDPDPTVRTYAKKALAKLQTSDEA